MDCGHLWPARGNSSRRTSAEPGARRQPDADPRGDDAARAGRLPSHRSARAASSSSGRPRKRSSRSSKSARRSRAWRRGSPRSTRRMNSIGALRHMFDEFHSSAPSEHLHEYSDANIAFHQAIINLSGSQPDVQDDREPLRPRPGDSPHDDLTEGSGVAIDRRSHAHHPGAGAPRHRAGRAAGADSTRSTSRRTSRDTAISSIENGALRAQRSLMSSSRLGVAPILAHPSCPA